MKRVEKFLKEDVCPDCRGTRLSTAARAFTKGEVYVRRRRKILAVTSERG